MAMKTNAKVAGYGPGPPASPPRNSKAGKKESTDRRPSRLCQPCATPSSSSSLDYRRSSARIAENGFATSSGVSKSAKVVLAGGVPFSREAVTLPWLIGAVVAPETAPERGIQA
jgi:hypothetical protein